METGTSGRLFSTHEWTPRSRVLLMIFFLTEGLCLGDMTFPQCWSNAINSTEELPSEVAYLSFTSSLFRQDRTLMLLPLALKYCNIINRGNSDILPAVSQTPLLHPPSQKPHSFNHGSLFAAIWSYFTISLELRRHSSI